jgi:hypothetical protein
VVEVGNVADATLKKTMPSLPTIAAADGFVFTAPVGKFRANGFGLHGCDRQFRQFGQRMGVNESQNR